MLNHIAVYLTDRDNKHELIDGIINGIMISDYADKKGALFSEITLNKFIDEEIRHGHFDMITSANNSLHKSSDGERKKALLKHLISTNPEYLILDNIFGSLDQISQKEIKNSLKELSKKIPIVQLTKRMNDILGFVNQIYQYSGKALVPVKNINTWNKKKKDSFIGFLPEAYQRIKIKSGSLVELKNVTVTYGSRTILNNMESIKDCHFCCSWSGGKDSCLALYRAIQEGGKPDIQFFIRLDDNIACPGCAVLGNSGKRCQRMY